MVVFLLGLSLLAVFGTLVVRVLGTTSGALRSLIPLQDQMARTAARRTMRRVARPPMSPAAPPVPDVETVPFDPIPAPEVVIVPTGDGDEAWVFGTLEQLDAMGPTLAWAPRYLDEWVTGVMAASDGVAADHEAYGRLIALDTESSEALHACHATQTSGRATLGFVRDAGGRFHAVPLLGPVRGPAATAMPNALATVALEVELDHLGAHVKAHIDSGHSSARYRDFFGGAIIASRDIRDLCRSALNEGASASASWLQIHSIADDIRNLWGEVL